MFLWEKVVLDPFLFAALFSLLKGPIFSSIDGCVYQWGKLVDGTLGLRQLMLFYDPLPGVFQVLLTFEGLSHHGDR